MMNPDKRGNPPFEPSSHAAGLERRVHRLAAWANDATEAARMLLDGNEADKAFGRAWWRRHLDQPQVVASGMSTGTAKTPKAVEGRSPASPVANGETPKA